MPDFYKVILNRVPVNIVSDKYQALEIIGAMIVSNPRKEFSISYEEKKENYKNTGIFTLESEGV